MSLINVQDPVLQGIFRQFATEAVEFLVSINAVQQHDERPEPGTQDQTVNVVNVKEGLRISLITEWRVNDLTRHVRIWELESGEQLIDIVYAEGGDEELEQLLVDDLWLISIIEKCRAITLLPPPPADGQS